MTGIEVMQGWREELEPSRRTRASLNTHNENVDSVGYVVLMLFPVFPHANQYFEEPSKEKGTRRR